MRRRPLPLLIVSLVIVACGDDKGAPRAASTPRIPNAASLLPSVPGSTPAITPGASSQAGGSTTPSPGPTDVGPSPAPIAPGSIEDDVPVEATISPSCVVRGGTAKITITTEPRNAVAFHAVYAGTKGGAPPPFGYGYGGDDRGHANDKGIWTGTWIVRVDAPVGPARADVIAADGESFGYDDPPFYVAASSAGCPG
ncbi:MAG: hypothetical protein ACRDKS_05965 [Actinomycetota bacterium]